MTPGTINNSMTPNDLVFTSQDSSKYNIELFGVYDLTDSSLNTDKKNYPLDSYFVAGHTYAIETKFTAVNPYEYNEFDLEYISKFYINDQLTDMSAATALSGSRYRRIELVAENDVNGVVNANATITTPVAGNKPDFNPVSSDNDKYSVEVDSWYLYEGNNPTLNENDTFIPGKRYALRINFIPKNPYNINNTTFTVNGLSTTSAGQIGQREIIFEVAPNGSHIVTFNLDGGSMNQLNTVAVNDGEKVSKPTPDPTKNGYTFGGWFENAELSIPFDFNKNITSDIPVFAKWIPEKYTITLNPNNNTQEENSISDIDNGTVVSLGTPESYNFTIPEGKEFDGWNIDGVKYNAGKEFVVHSNLLAKAMWKDKEKFTVEFNSNGGSEVDSIQRYYYDMLGELPTSTKEGYTLEGWYSDQELQNRVTDTTKIISNTTLYAKWNKDVYTVDFNSNGGTSVESIQREYYDMLGDLPISTKDGYKLEGWYSDQELQNRVTDTTKIISNTTLYAKWNEIQKYSLNSNGNKIEFEEEKGKTFNIEIIDIMSLTKEQIIDMGATEEEVNEIIKKVKDAINDSGTLIKALQIVVTDGNVEVHEVEGGFKLKIKATDDMNQYDTIKLIYVDSNYNTEEPIIMKKNGDYYEATLNHLSGYAIVGTKKSNNISNNPKTYDGIIMWSTLFTISFITLLFGIYRLKKSN